MKNISRRLMKLVIYFFTPVDSTQPFRSGRLSADINFSDLDLGAAKALFWVINVWLILYLVIMI